MGDRANVKIVDYDSTVFLYTHHNGYKLPNVLKRALARRERWYDGAYLARIIFQEMIGNDKSDSGFGISSVIGDGDDHVLVVDIKNQTVSYEDRIWSLNHFINANIDNW